jgi:hypothetical protein
MSREKDQTGKNQVSIPTESDWGSYQSDLDQKYAHDLFAGHSNEEMQHHFRRNPIERTDELRFMPEVPFRYYVLGFRDFVMSGDFEPLDAPDAASCFLRLALQKLETQPGYIVPVMPELLPAIQYVASNQEKFRADKKIYGDFQKIVARIQSLYAAQGAP